MTDYSKMSDFEINRKVAAIIFPGDQNITPYSHRPDVQVFHKNNCNSMKDYCNDPADAWPIIVEHGIGFYRIDDAEDTAKDMIGEWHATGPVDWAYGERDSLFDSRHKNPLRAAMIIFLMMKDAKAKEV